MSRTPAHDDAHDHGHVAHAHRHDAGQGPVVVDVGAGTGVLVLLTAADLVGAEIDITPTGDDGDRRHVAVHTRPVPGHRPVHAAVYDGLTAGRYRLWWPPGEVAGEVRVDADRVTEVEWSDLRTSRRPAPEMTATEGAGARNR